MRREYICLLEEEKRLGFIHNEKMKNKIHRLMSAIRFAGIKEVWQRQEESSSRVNGWHIDAISVVSSLAVFI